MKFQKSYTLKQLAELVKGKISGADEHRVIEGIAALSDATSHDISFLANVTYLSQLHSTHAGAVILSEQHAQNFNGVAIVSDNPYAAFARIAQLCVPPLTGVAGIHKTAVVDASAKVDATAVIGPYVSIAANAVIGPHVILDAGCHVGENVHIDAATHCYPNVTLYAGVRVGKNCLLHSGVVIGADGFGFAQEHGRWLKVPQLGAVLIEDDVEIGANTTIDRGTLFDTHIGQGVKIDNQCQIGHNVQIGAHTIIAGCVAIAGSARIGRHCGLGGGARINGHIEIGDQVQITATSGVLGSIDKAGIYSSGVPAIEHGRWMRVMVLLPQLPDLFKRLRKLEKEEKT